MNARGRMSVFSAAHATGLSLSEADRALTALANAGHVSIENDPASGVVIYVFPEIEAAAAANKELR
jgi:hypothetical protein